MNEQYKIQGVNFSRKLAGAAGRLLLLIVFANGFMPLSVQAHEGENHGGEQKTTVAAAGNKAAVSIVKAERNVQSNAGQFNARLDRSPADPRAGETVQTALRLAETIEGGFGNEPLALADAKVVLNVTTADGKQVAQNLPAKAENGVYRHAYAFGGAGEYKLVYAVTTADQRNFTVDFPVSVVRAPVNWFFWLGTTVLSLLTLGALAWVFNAYGRGGNIGARVRRVAPLMIAAILFFAFGTVALAFFAPPTARRETAEINVSADEPAVQTSVASATSTQLTVPKESQLLFGIKTEPVAVRQITSGLRTTGVVRSRPDQRAVVVPPVAGRIVLRQGLGLGSAVGRGEQIGTVEQVLDVSGQVELESQRLEIESQQREIESQRLELRNRVLELQANQAEQRANANAARTRLAQAQRELRRSENLVAVNAVPRRRVEEANTAVRVAEQEVQAAEQQVKLLDTQIRAAQAGQTVFRAPRVNQPTRAFPLAAPVAGVINEIRATSGQLVESGAELLTIVNLASVQLEAQVFERDLPVVRESTRASFVSPALNGEVYRIGEADGDGRLVSIGQTVNQETRTVPVIYEVRNPLQRLRDGMFVEITIDTSGGAEVLAVPKRAVINEQGQTFVFVFTGGETFERRLVALGAEGADFYEVRTGLKEGDRIVTEGVYQLRSTQPSA